MRTLLIVGAETEPSLHQLLEKAASRVWPEGVQVRPVSTLKEARASTPDSPECLVLINPSREHLDAAAAVVDELALPRWPLLVLGSDNAASGNEAMLVALPREEWNEAALGRALRHAVMQHASRRENVRARGDLRTLAQRFAHDLRAQLGGVLTAADLLQEIVASGDSPDASHLRPIFDSTEGTVRLLERMSFVIRASTASRGTEELNMGMAFWAALQRLEAQITRGNASLRQPDDWPSVTGVTDWLEVVWWNFLTNALQHSGPNPQLVAGWEPAGKEQRFWLTDTGVGVPTEKRHLLFHPLHRLHEPNAPSGVGLPIVQRLIGLQGGRCGYEARPEGGSCFYFVLPARNG